MNNDLTVLIVEDDPHVLLGCQQALSLEDIPCEGVASAEAALERIGDNFPGIVISDIRLPGIDGLELLTRLKARDRSLPVVLITGHGDISMAVGAMRAGAYDFMEKPFSPERLVEVARRALEQRGLAREVWALRRQLAERDSLEGRIIGRSGTGKELVARCLHDFSRRQSQQFVALNCGGLPENLFESEIFGHEANAFTGAGKRRIGKIEHAHGGTLFLDEVESMPRKHADTAADQTAAGPAGAHPGAPGLEPERRRGLPGDRRDQVRPGRTGQGRRVSQRSVLPSERGDPGAAPVARAARRYPATVRAFPAAVVTALRSRRAGTGQPDPVEPDEPRLAR